MRCEDVRAGTKEPERFPFMIMKLFEKLNNPIAVVLILAAMLAVNGYLFYQQGSTPPEANAPSQNETPPEPERNPEPANEDAKDKGSGERNEAEDAKSEEDEERQEEQREEQASGEQGEEEPEQPPGDESQNGSASDEPRNESGDGESQNGSASDGSGGGGSQSGQEGRGSEEERESAPLAGLGGALDGCEGDREDCVRDFVSQASPDSRYIGGRMDLASGGSGRNAEILYFEDPGMEACQYERGRYESEDDLDYTVILIGPGSFNDERGEECIPTT